MTYYWRIDLFSLRNRGDANAAETVQKGTAEELKTALKNMHDQSKAIKDAMAAYMAAMTADALQYDLSGK